MRVGQRLQVQWQPLSTEFPGTYGNYDTEDMKQIPLPRWTRMMNTGIGVEVEVERVREQTIDGWIIERDSSLRNHGWEYKTRYGTRAYQIPTLFSALKLSLERNSPQYSFSERTSIHVHLDVRTFNEAQLQNLLMLYTLAEDAMFRLTGGLRKCNIFCVPLRGSLQGSPANSVWDFFGRARKYTALNVVPIGSFGTVEFRHMEGNLDIPRLWNWIVILLMLHSAAKTWKTADLVNEIRSVKTSSQYATILETTFGPMLPFLTWRNEELDEAVTDAKFFFFPNVKGL